MTKTLPYQTLSERLKSTCKILFGHWTKIMLFPLTLYFFVFLLSKLPAFLETTFPKMFDNLLLASLFSLFLLSVVCIAFFVPNISIIWSTNEIIKSKKITAKNLITNAFKNFFRYIKISAWILVYLGTIPLIVLGVSTLVYMVSPIIGSFCFELTKLFTLIFFLVRLPRIVMSFPLGITEISLGAKELVQKSKQLSQGFWWKIFGNLALVSFISFLVTGLSYLIRFGLKVNFVLFPKTLLTVSALVDILIQTHVFAFTLIFLFLLTKRQLELSPKDERAAN